MTKINPREITCKYLEKAYDEAVRAALDRAKRPPYGVRWNAGEHGNSVTIQASAEGTGTCSRCSKRVTATLHFESIEGQDERDGDNVRPITLYDLISGKESIRVSGHTCAERQS